MKKRLLLMVMVLLLLVGCTPDAAGPSGTNATTQPTTAPELKKSYPTPLESEFAVCFNKIDKVFQWTNLSDRIYFYIVTKNSITPEEVSVKTGDIVWTVELFEEEKYEVNSPGDIISQANIYPSFMAYKNVDWKALYALTGESRSAFTDAYNQHMEECSQKWQDWFPEFHCYYVMISSPNGVEPYELDVEEGHTETELTITVKGETKVLKDVFTMQSYRDFSNLPNYQGPMIIYQMSMSNDNLQPTDEGYFYFDEYMTLLAREDLTITGVSFLHCTTASFVKLQLVINDVRMDWDGKTPVDVAAGELVQLRFVAKDPTLANKIVTTVNRTPLLEYTSGGENYIQAVDCTYRFSMDFYESYAFANGNGKGLSSYYADYQSKRSGWSYDGSGTGDNPFDKN